MPVLAGCGDNIPWLSIAAEEVRELSLKRDVKVVSMSREEFAARAAANADAIDPDALIYYADTYGRLGFFDRNLDLRPIFARSSSEWVGATYSPSTKQITLVGEASDQTVVHEYVHAIQDQNFDLISYDRGATNDSFLARRAVVEGDAMLAEYRFAVRENRGVDLDQANWLSAFDSLRDYSTDILLDADYPVVFLDYVSFVYSHGFELGAANLAGVTYDAPTPATAGPYPFARQDELFLSRAPETTEVVHRLGVAKADDPVVTLGFTEVPPALAERYALLDWDRLGFWHTYLLLYPLASPTFDPVALAREWDGDRATFLRDRDSGEIAVVWASAWDSPAAAAEIAARLTALHGLGTDGIGADGEPGYIEVAHDRVVIVRNAPRAEAATLASAALVGGISARPRTQASLSAFIDSQRRQSPWRSPLPRFGAL